MSLPTTGPISLSQVNVELGRSATATISMNESAVRTLFGIGSGAISMQDGRGKANQFALTIASNQSNLDLRSFLVNSGWNQASRAVVTLNSGVWISSSSTATPALTISGSFPGGLEFINNGLIVGMGGMGGGQGPDGPLPGAGGGPALSVSSPIEFRNNNTIAGGGGGGGFAAASTRIGFKNAGFTAQGGTGGGGRSSLFSTGTRGVPVTQIIPYSGGNDNLVVVRGTGGGGQGTSSGPGGGGVPGRVVDNANGTAGEGGFGGAGGGWGAPGAMGGTCVISTISGSSCADPGFDPATRNGGAGGAAVLGNGNITWLATGSRFGAIS